jgi:hypothetical protein
MLLSAQRFYTHYNVHKHIWLFKLMKLFHCTMTHNYHTFQAYVTNYI